jgi:hypothetical protein
MSTALKPPVRYIDVIDPDKKQTVVTLLPDFIRPFPADTPVEFRASKDTLTLTLANPLSPATVKRYKITRHSGSAFVSIPRSWLRDRNAKTGDRIDVHLDPSNYSQLILKLIKRS